MRMVSHARASLVAAVTLAAGPAAAQPADAITVAWSAPPGCPAAAEIDAAVDRLLGGAPQPAERALRVHGVVTTRESGGFDLALETEDERGERGRRVLSGATCEALADAAALVVALGWDPAAVAAARQSTSPADPRPAPGPTAVAPPGVATPPPAAAPAPRDGAGVPRGGPPPPDPRAAVAPGSRAPDASAGADGDPDVGLGLGVLVEAGGLPGVTLGFGGSGALLLGAYRIEIGVAGLPSAQAALEADSARGGRFGQVLGTGALCRAIAPWGGGGAGHEVAACLGLEAGAIFATGFGVDQQRDVTVPWVAPRLGTSGRLALGRGLGVRADLVLAAPILRDTFLLDDLGQVHRAAPVAGRAAAGLDLRF